MKQACELYEKKVPLHKIKTKLGIKSPDTILFRCNPEYRKKRVKTMYAWRKKNPEAAKRIQRKASKKYYYGGKK
jgi:hypothetical protein